MNQEKLSIWATVVNALLAVLKIAVGMLSQSFALIADGIHSGLDILSSFITFLGIKIAKKPVDEKHPYGFYRVETLSGLVVVAILLLSAFWIVFEGVQKLFNPEGITFSLWAILVVIISIVANEVMARIKYKVGKETRTVSLVADAQHSRADAISSVGVLIGILFARIFIYSDGLIAVFIGLYIIIESIKLGREITDSLLDVRDEEVEKKIKEIVKKHNIGIEEIKSRKIGSIVFAEVKIMLPPQRKAEDIDIITKKIREELISTIEELRDVVFSVGSSGEARLGALKKYNIVLIDLPKKGKRYVVPLEQGEIADDFGAEKYLVFDIENDKNVFIDRVRNPFFEKDKPHGMKFFKAVSGDYVITKSTSQQADNIIRIPATLKLKDLYIKYKLDKK